MSTLELVLSFTAGAIVGGGSLLGGYHLARWQAQRRLAPEITNDILVRASRAYHHGQPGFKMREALEAAGFRPGASERDVMPEERLPLLLRQLQEEVSKNEPPPRAE